MNVRSGKRGAAFQAASARSAWGGWGRLADAREADRMSAPLGSRRPGSLEAALVAGWEAKSLS